MLSEKALEKKREYNRNYKKLNKEKINAYQRKYAREYPEKILEFQMRYWEKKVSDKKINETEAENI